MAYETYHGDRHTTLITFPDFSTRRKPMGLVSILPGTVRDDKRLDEIMYGLQRKAHFFPDELIADILSSDQSPEIASELSSILNDGTNPGEVYFVYFPSVRRPNGKPKVGFDAAVVTSRGYDGLPLPSDFAILHREGQPVVGVGTVDNKKNVFSDQKGLANLQRLVLKEFGDPLGRAKRPHFVPDEKGFAKVYVNPADAYRPMRS